MSKSKSVDLSAVHTENHSFVSNHGKLLTVFEGGAQQILSRLPLLFQKLLFSEMLKRAGHKMANLQ